MTSKTSGKDLYPAELHARTVDSILFIFLIVQGKYNVSYSTLKRVTIQKLLTKYYKIRISLSAISYHLTNLRKMNFIRVYERYGRFEDGRVFNLPSNRALTGRCLSYLKRMGIEVSKSLWNWAFKGYKFPRQKKIVTSSISYSRHFKASWRSPSSPEILGTVLNSVLDAMP